MAQRLEKKMKNHKGLKNNDLDEGIPYVSPAEAIDEIQATLDHAKEDNDCDCIPNEECAVAAVAIVVQLGPLLGAMAVEYAQNGAYRINAQSEGACIEIIVTPDQSAFQDPDTVH